MRRPARVTFTPPAGSNWRPATQLFTTADPWTFTAPNLQYLFDSPTELSAFTLREFEVGNPDGKTFTIRAAVHTESPDRDIDEYAAGVEKIVRESMPIFGEYPVFDTGTYTFLPTTCRATAGTAWSIATAPSSAAGATCGRARHRLARVLPRLERRTDPAAGARAVQLRRSEPDRLALGRRRVHAVLRLADHGCGPGCPT